MRVRAREVEVAPRVGRWARVRFGPWIVAWCLAGAACAPPPGLPGHPDARLPGHPDPGPSVLVPSAAAPEAAPEAGPDAGDEAQFPPFEPNAPFTIIARAGPHDRFVVLPFEAPNGEALIAVIAAGGEPGVPRFARLASDVIELAPELSAGMPALGGDGSSWRAAGSFEADLWFASGTPCEVRGWQGGSWVVAPPARSVSAGCSRLSAWTKGAALAALDGPNQELAIFGAAPAVLPVLTPGKAATRPDCPRLVAYVVELRGFASGELVAVGAGCAEPDIWLEFWAPGAAASSVSSTGLSNVGPIDVKIPSPGEVVIDAFAGGPTLPDGDVRQVMTRRGSRFSVAASKPASKNAVELWMVVAKQLLGLPPDDPATGFVYQDRWLGADREVFVAGTLVRDRKPAQTLLLRSRPVATPLLVPSAGS